MLFDHGQVMQVEKVTWMGQGRHQGSQGHECDQVYMGQGCLVQLAKVQGQGQGKA